MNGFNPRPNVNRKGPMGNTVLGPAGPTGATGATGATGPAGENWNIVSKTANYNANNLDEVWCTGTFTVTLPTSTLGNRVKIVNSGTGAITASPQSGTIIGNSTMVLGTQYSVVELACNGTNWTVE